MPHKPKRFISDCLLASANNVPDKTAVVVEGQAYTYGSLLENASKLATALVSRGLRKGDRVAIFMDNTWPCIISIYAVSLAGGVFLIVNPQTKSDKLAYILNDSESKILLTDIHLKEVFLHAGHEVQGSMHVLCSGKEEVVREIISSAPYPVEHFFDVINSSHTLNNTINTTPVDLAALIYTSGSTGNPKGVMHTHLSMMFALDSLIEYQRLCSSHVLLNVLPFAFDYGLYQLLMTVGLGATLVLERSFTYPALVFKRIQEYEVNVFPGVPTIFSMLLAAHSRKKIEFPSVVRVTNTAAALPAEYIPKLRQIFPNALIYKMYGLTECKRVSFLEPELIDTKSKSVGKAIPGTEVFLLSSDGDKVEPGELGILHVRGPHVMLGYWKQPELSRKMLKEGALSGERVLCTHDWFRIDDEGFLYFVGRSDDIIKSRGEKVSPIEVENVLHAIHGVLEAAVIGCPDEILGEKIIAYIALDTDSNLSEKDIKKICLAHLENFMVPQEIIIQHSLPKTTTGKVSKKLLKESYENK